MRIIFDPLGSLDPALERFPQSVLRLPFCPASDSLARGFGMHISPYLSRSSLMSRFLAVSLVACLLLLSRCVHAQHRLDADDKRIAKASDEPRQALKRIQLPAGLEAEVYAAEPLLAN